MMENLPFSLSTRPLSKRLINALRKEGGDVRLYFEITSPENIFSGTITVLSITSKNVQKVYPFEVFIEKGEGNLPKNSKVKADQLRTLEKGRIVKFIGSL